MKKSLCTVSLMIVFISVFWGCDKRNDPNVIRMYALNQKGTSHSIGTVHTEETPHGVLLTPRLQGLPPGLHGFHVHEQGNCAGGQEHGKMVPGLAAGGHYDPAGTNAHKGPFSDGHLGDLPALYVDSDGRAALPVLAPRLKLSDLKGRALMIHAGGDNYSDKPEKLGGGGDRIACGVIPE
ncbi:MAG: superoxide dismutase [Cu-Zn] SodC2 [Desulfobacteraceae bacterium]|nr:MAG: superoxide dismutase [Cu-Zn] SodC2 [Desulfobacteraceae bacterium]